MEICNRFICANRGNKECRIPKNVIAFMRKYTDAPCPKARREYCAIEKCRNKMLSGE